jgi:hypothetical protein
MCKVLVGYPEGKRLAGGPKCRCEGVWTGLGSVQRPVSGPCAYGNEPSGFTKLPEHLDLLSNYWFLSKVFATWSLRTVECSHIGRSCLNAVITARRNLSFMPDVKGLG